MLGKTCLASMLSRVSNLWKIRLGQMVSVRSQTDRYVTRIPAVLDLQALGRSKNPKVNEMKNNGRVFFVRYQQSFSSWLHSLLSLLVCHMVTFVFKKPQECHQIACGHDCLCSDCLANGRGPWGGLPTSLASGEFGCPK